MGLDSEWYLAEKIIITRPLSITSLNDTKVDVRVTPSSETFDLPALPVVRAAERGILVDSVTGYVSIANITVHGLAVSQTLPNPFQLAPGFLFIGLPKFMFIIAVPSRIVAPGPLHTKVTGAASMPTTVRPTSSETLSPAMRRNMAAGSL